MYGNPKSQSKKLDLSKKSDVSVKACSVDIELINQVQCLGDKQHELILEEQMGEDHISS